MKLLRTGVERTGLLPLVGIPPRGPPEFPPELPPEARVGVTLIGLMLGVTLLKALEALLNL